MTAAASRVAAKMMVLIMIGRSIHEESGRAAPARGPSGRYDPAIGAGGLTWVIRSSSQSPSTVK